VKKISRIAKIELSTLFYSPIAWLLLIVFFIQCAGAYTESMQAWITIQELGGEYKEQIAYMTSIIFGYPAGISPTVVSNLYLYLPLLTMGLISREVSGGTIKLLYSSPIKTKDIVFGKFLAISAYSLLLTLVLGVFLLAGTFHLENADIGLLLAIMLGVFLLLSAYGAIGLFVSCLTSYQVVAAICTFVIFAFLGYIRDLWQDIDFVRDITYSLSIVGRIGNMGSGLITTKDVCYFLVIVYIFIGLSILKLQAVRSNQKAAVKAGKYLALILSALVIGYITSRPSYTLYLDTTETKTKTLTEASQKLLKQMKDGPLEVTSYINLLDNYYWNGVPQERNTDLERWLPYIRFKPDITLKYVYYYDSIPDPYFYKQYPGKTLDEIASIFSKSFRVNLKRFKTPEEIRKIIDLRPERNRYVMHLKYNSKSTFLRLFDDVLVYPGEQEIGAALKRMIVKLPKIAFLEGELERSPTKAGDKDYKTMTSLTTFRYAMVNQGFDFITLSLKENEVPSDVSGLVIADPKSDFEPAVLAKIQKYIDEGGNLLIAGEPGKQSVLNPLLTRLGVRMTEGMIVQKSEDYSPSLVLPFLTASAAGFSKTLQKIFKDSIKIGMPTTAGLLYTDTGKFKIQSLLMTDERFSWRKVDELSSDSAKVSFAASKGDEQGKFSTMLALTRTMPNGREQRILVSSDADFMSSMELSRFSPVTGNFRFTTVLFGWLSNGEFPIDTSRPDAKDKLILLKGDDIPLLKLMYVWIIPFVIFIIGTIILVRRKRQ
jgi:ABC-2 type transport system permease protein